MSAKKNYWIIECSLLITYCLILVFLFFPTYFSVYSYMVGIKYEFDISKFIISISLLIISFFALYIHNDGFEKTEGDTYAFVIRIFETIFFIPMLAVFTCSNTLSSNAFIAPGLFGLLLLFTLKYFGSHQQKSNITISFRPIRNADLSVLIASGAIALITWAIAGFPVVANFNESYEQRMLLRAQSLPTIINYLYTMVGGAIIPYLFARNLILKKYGRMILCLVFGILLFFVNGMKTWFLLYLFAIVIYIVYRKTQKMIKLSFVIEISFIMLSVLSVVLFITVNSLEILSLLGRIISIPNTIGFKFIDFFSQHELLYLRESIFRAFADSPYPGGSDFYISHGTDTTITSSRSNNGLYGDAYRNFGLVGIIIYPLLIAKTFSIMERNSRNEDPYLRYYLMIILAWGTVNTSFFTWLLTGGVILLFILLKIYQANYKAYHKLY